MKTFGENPQSVRSTFCMISCLIQYHSTLVTHLHFRTCETLFRGKLGRSFIYAELVQGTDQPSPPVSCCSNIGLSLSDAVHKPRPPVFEILRPLIRVYNACQTDIKQSERVYIPLSCSVVFGIRTSASITVKDIQGTRGKYRR
jgi:hypothetical protein